MMDYKAKYRSSGFRGKFWEKGQIAKDVTKEELKLSEMVHFELASNKEPKKPSADNPQYLSLITYRKAYVDKYTKDVPSEYKDDIKWLKKMVDGAAFEKKPSYVLEEEAKKAKALETEVVEEEAEDIDILNLRTEYMVKFDKEVPNNMKNNIDWIKTKIEEAQ